MSNITDKLYKFCMNRKLIEYPTSIDLLPIDIHNNLGINFNRFNNLYNQLINDISSLCKESNLVINNKFNNLDDNIYKELITLKHSINKSLYRISYEDYLYKFISDSDIILSDKIKHCYVKYYNYSYNNKALSDYIYKYLLSMLIFKDKESIEFYNKSRCSYLYNLIKSNFSIEPIYYDINSGSLYFSIPYNANKFNLKQIIGQLRNSDLIIDNVNYSINLDIGSLTKYYRYSKLITHSINIEDQTSYNTPNIIRMLFKDMCLKMSNKKVKITYTDILHNIINTHLIYIEHYCQKILDDFSKLLVPYKHSNQWELMNSNQVRKLNINDISLELLQNTYNDDIKVLRDSLSLLK